MFVLIVIVGIVVILMMTVCEATCKLERGIGASNTAAELERHIFINRTGVRLFLLHAQFGQHVEYDTGFYFKLPRQLINSNFLHRRELLDNPLRHRTL
jgi:hypothetical protein